VENYQQKFKAYRRWNRVGIGAVIVFLASVISRELMAPMAPMLERIARTATCLLTIKFKCWPP